MTDGAIDEKRFAANIDILMRKGATGIVVGGCTGEFWALSHGRAQARSSSWASKAMAGRGIVIVGTGAITRRGRHRC